jgi:hypothetical protein
MSEEITDKKIIRQQAEMIKDLWRMVIDHRQEIFGLERHNHELFNEIQKLKKKVSDE